MKSSLKKQAERFLREQKNYKRWLAVFVCLAVVVTIGTTAALKYKGIAVTSDDSATEAMHMEQTEGNTDEIPEGMRRHVHTEACYEEQLVLICGMTGAGETADAGAADTETSDAGTADSGASNTGAAPEESEPADTSQGHTHSDDCYEVTGGTEKLTCTIEEHTHGDKCYETKMVTETVTKTVPETVTEEVKNEDGSVSTVEKTVDKTVEETVEKEEKVLTCTKKEHTHGASCYTVEGGERTLVCGKEEGEGAAVPTVVNAEAATAPAAVNADATAETPAESASAAAETTAPTTTESTAAEAPAESADTEAAEAPAENADTETAGNTGAASAENTEAAEAPAGEHVHDDSCYEPQMVLICGKEEGELEPIEPLSDEMNLVQTAEAGGYKVTVTYSESAEIPESAVLRVTEYDKESDEYAKRCEELGYQPDALLNIGFYDGDEEIEPKKPVLVKITDANVDKAEAYEIAHFGADGTDEMRTGAAETKEGMETEFLLESFSEVTVTADENSKSVSRSSDFAALGELAHEKMVEPGPKDTEGNVPYYDLTLNVKGAAGSRPGNAKLDILFVLDTSGSMDWAVEGKSAKGDSRLSLADESIKNLVTDLDAAGSGIDAQYKLITFATSADTRGAGSWMNGDSLVDRLPENANGGTNYEDALEEAAAAISTGRTDAEQIILFLTDGAPTYYNNDEGKTKGPGSRTDTTCINEAKNGAQKIADTHTCEYFYVVGYGSEMTKDTVICKPDWTPKKILTEVAETSGSSKGYYVETTQDLTQFFTKFKQGLTTINAVDVSFTDELTDKVQLVNENGKIVNNVAAEAVWIPKIEVIDSNGTVTKTITGADECKAYNNCGMTVAYGKDANGNVDMKKVVVDFADNYVLEENHIYSITAKIAPTAEAKQEYINNGYRYPEANTEAGKAAGTGRGEAYTGSESSGRPGIFCNTEEGAKVSYKCQETDENGNVSVSDTRELPYPRPVVQVQAKPEVEMEQNLPHRKYIKATGEIDVYDLTLDVEGSSGGGKYDILFLVDVSGSMDSRAKQKESLEALYNEIAKRDTEKNKYSVVRFSGDAGTTVDWKEGPDFEGELAGLNLQRIDGRKSDFEDGLEKVAAQMIKGNIRNDGAEKVVFFLTDGVPTDNGDQQEKNDTIDSDERRKAINKAKNIKCDYFYSIKFGDLADNKNDSAIDVLESIASATNNNSGCSGKSGVVQVAGNTVSPNEAQSIVNNIMGSGFTSKNVKIEDTLSQWVEPNTVGTEYAPMNIKVVRKADDSLVGESSGGNIEDGATLTLNENGTAHTLIVSYENGKITLDLDSGKGYELNPDYRYSVTIQIRPSDDAYEKALEVKSGESSYTDIGGTGTDADGVSPKISEGVNGLHTNTVATVSYWRGDNPAEPEGYENPVIVPTLAQLTVQKTIKSTVLEKEHFDKLHNGMGFSLDGSSVAKLPESGNGEVVNAGKTDITYTVYDERWLKPGTHRIEEQNADMAGYRRTTTREVSAGGVQQEQNASLSSTRASISLKPGESGTVKFTNQYDASDAVIALKKQDGEEKFQTVFKDITFEIRDLSDEGELKDVETRSDLDEVIDGLAKVADIKLNEKGKTWFENIDESYGSGNTEKATTLHLEQGTYIVREVWETPGDYTIVYPFKLFVNKFGEAKIGKILWFENNDAVIVDTVEPTNKDETSYDQIVVTNEIMTLAELRILKVSSQAVQPYEKGLDGAKFDLYRGDPPKDLKDLKDEKPYVSGLTSNEKGLITSDNLKGLKAGKYYLIETEAPDGYMLLANPIKFEVIPVLGNLGNRMEVHIDSNVSKFVIPDGPDGRGGYREPDLKREEENYHVEGKDEIWTLAITNDTGAVLPVTGGPGTVAYTFGGLAMIIAVSLMYGLNMRRKRGKGGLK